MIGHIVDKIPKVWYKCNDGTFSTHNRKGACLTHCGLSTKTVRLVNKTSARTIPAGIKSTQSNQVPADIVLVELTNIFTNPEWFQNREKAFSLRSVENIVGAVENGTFTWANFDAITIWDHNGKFYILSGHSRTEAFTRLCAQGATIEGRNFCSIPAKIVTGINLEQAKKIAMESNTLSTRETDIERAQYYRRMLAINTPVQEVRAAAARMEGKEAVKVLAFAYLNPNGKTVLGMRALENADQTSRNNLTNIARWIGNARQTVTALTDQHENELYEWLVNYKAYGTAKGQISSETDFKSRLASILQKRTAFGVLEDSLNIQGSITKSPTEQTYDDQVKEALKLVTDLDNKYKGKIRDLTTRGATQAQVQEITAGLQASLTRARVNYQNLLLNRNEIAQASRNDLALFGIGRIEKERPPGRTECVDGNFSTYLPGRGVCSYHGGPIFIKSNKQATLPKEPVLSANGNLSLVQEAQRRITSYQEKEQELRNRIQSMMNAGFTEAQIREGSYFKDFEQLKKDQQQYEKLIDGSFLKSRNSTGVNTRIVVIEKPYSSTISGYRRRMSL